MPDYSQSKIYKIQPIIEHDEGDIYIGSTTLKLNDRFTGHKSNFKSYIENKANMNTSYYLFEKYGVENCEIVLLEDVECSCKKELELKEKHYILNNKCVNKVIPTQTMAEYYKKNKQVILKYNAERYELNKEALKEKSKKYYEQHKEDTAEKRKHYYHRNRDAILKQKAEYRERNKDAIKQRSRERYKQLKEQKQEI